MNRGVKEELGYLPHSGLSLAVSMNRGVKHLVAPLAVEGVPDMGLNE